MPVKRKEMSWNKYFILVTDIGDRELDDTIKWIGYNQLELSEKIEFRRASVKNYEGMGFGIYENCFWIVSADQVEKCFQETPSSLEKNLCKRFPESTIMAVAENGTVDAFGLNLIKEGKRIRVISGCDGEYEFEYGEPLQIEVEILQRVEKELDENEKSEIVENEGEEGLQNWIKFEALWRVPFDLLANELGKSIDEVYEANPEFAVYKLKQ